MKNLNKKQKISLATGLLTLLIFIIGATYAYFSIGINDTTTDSTVAGVTNKYGTASLTTNTSKLYLKITNDEMSEDYKGTTYYANSDSSGTPLTTNPNYILATAKLTDGDLPLDCTYNFKVTSTITKEITDGSDNNVKVTIGDSTKTLKEILAAGDSGIIVNGKLKNLVTGTNQTITVSSSILNTSSNQNGLSGNSYTITISPYNSEKNKAFSCNLQYTMKSNKTLAQNLIDSNWLWQSELEGDGYRYIGSGAVGTEKNPNNFICFGTTSKSECIANEDKYMYRIIGVFSDSLNYNCVKLVKYKQLGAYAWNANYNSDVSWSNSDLYNSLNGNEFLTSSTYNYFFIPSWSNRIENWPWSAVNTKVDDGGLRYRSTITSQIYLHEMNRSTKTSTVGEWTTPSAKIGLMYASDYLLSIGPKSLNLSTNYYPDAIKIGEGWIYSNNNDTTKSDDEWTISREGLWSNGLYYGLVAYGLGSIGSALLDNEMGVRPTFYLTTDQSVTSGTGRLDDPFILKN